LLPKSSGFQSELVTRNKEGANVGDHREGERNHRLILLERHSRQNEPMLNPLILLENGILMTYRARSRQENSTVWPSCDYRGVIRLASTPRIEAVL